MRFDYLILAGGLLPKASFLKSLLKLSTEMVTIDRGGLGAIKLNLNPLLHVGDGDSLKKNELLKLKPKSTITLNQKKNMSDLEFALNKLGSKKTKLVVGAHIDNEGRSDHLFLNLLLLSKLENIFFADERNWITSLSPTKKISFTPPQNSLFSISVVEQGRVWITGASYTLKGKTLDYVTEGLSNRSRGRVRIKTQGKALLFVSSDITKTKIDGFVFDR